MSEVLPKHEMQVVLLVKGESKTIPMKQLSYLDQKYVRDQVDAQRKITALVEEQTWKDANGKTAKARLMGMDGDRVVLLTADGQTRLPFKKFCRDDQNTIRKEMTARGQPDKVPAAPPVNAHPKSDGSQIAQATQQGKKPKQPKPKPNPPAATSPEPATQQEVAANSQPPKSTNPGGPAEAAHPLKEPSASGQQATTQPAAVQPGWPTRDWPTRDWPNDADEDIRFAARAIAACSQQARAEARGRRGGKRASAARQEQGLFRLRTKAAKHGKSGRQLPVLRRLLAIRKHRSGAAGPSVVHVQVALVPAGLASLCCVIAVAVFRLRSYASHS